jgi:glyoxylase-like metal-dependent hydrolase (beta-lactamase superfamily II)
MGANCPSFPYGWASPGFNAVIASPAPARPIRYIVNTSAAPEHTGGNAILAAAGFFQRRGGTNLLGAPSNASIISHENTLIAMSSVERAGEDVPPEAWPTDTYFYRYQKLSEYFNGEGVVIYHEPAANTDGDSIVHFRQSEVISAGNVYSTVSYPRIEVDNGGSIQGVLDGLNHILELAVAEYCSQGGTWIVPSHGRLSDTGDVASYRNMVTIVRDRVAHLKGQGLSLREVLAARPTRDFDGRYDAYDDAWTAEMFVTAVYETLNARE